MSENKQDQNSTAVAETTSTKAGTKILAILGTLTVAAASINTIVTHASDIREQLLSFPLVQSIFSVAENSNLSSAQPSASSEEEIVGTYWFVDINGSSTKIQFRTDQSVILDNGDRGSWEWNEHKRTYTVSLDSQWTIENVRLNGASFSATQKAHGRNEGGPESGSITGDKV